MKRKKDAGFILWQVLSAIALLGVATVGVTKLTQLSLPDPDEDAKRRFVAEISLIQDRSLSAYSKLASLAADGQIPPSQVVWNVANFSSMLPNPAKNQNPWRKPYSASTVTKTVSVGGVNITQEEMRIHTSVNPKLVQSLTSKVAGLIDDSANSGSGSVYIDIPPPSSFSIVDSINTRLTALETATTDTNTTITTMQTDIASLKTSVSNLQTQVNTNTSNIATLQSTVTTIQGDITNLKSRMTTAEGNISQNASDIASIKSSITTIQNTLNTISTDLTDLQSRMATAESNISSINISISSLGSRMSAAESSLVTLRSDITTLQGQITTLQNQFNSLNSTVGNHETRIASLEARPTLSTGMLILMWGSCPAGTTDYSTLLQSRMPAIDPVAPIGRFGGSGTHSHTVTGNVGSHTHSISPGAVTVSGAIDLNVYAYQPSNPLFFLAQTAIWNLSGGKNRFFIQFPFSASNTSTITTNPTTPSFSGSTNSVSHYPPHFIVRACYVN